MSSPSAVAIVVLNFNGKDCLLGCLRSLEDLRYEAKEIIVVDNASEDGSLELARERFPRFTYIRNETNLGFAGGMNTGIREALAHGAEWCWLFNYDARARENSLSILMEYAGKHPEASLLSPWVWDRKGKRLWFAKGNISFLRMRTNHVRPNEKERCQEAYPSEYLAGCALLIKKDVIETIGTLDERFFLYYEDADYCLRASQAGFRSFVVPRACVWHDEKSRSNPQKLYHLVFSGLLFFRQHAPWYFRPYLAAYATIRRIKNRIDRLRGRDEALAVYQAYRDFHEYDTSHLPHLR